MIFQCSRLRTAVAFFCLVAFSGPSLAQFNPVNPIQVCNPQPPSSDPRWVVVDEITDYVVPGSWESARTRDERVVLDVSVVGSHCNSTSTDCPLPGLRYEETHSIEIVRMYGVTDGLNISTQFGISVSAGLVATANAEIGASIAYQNQQQWQETVTRTRTIRTVIPPFNELVIEESKRVEESYAKVNWADVMYVWRIHDLDFQEGYTYCNYSEDRADLRGDSGQRWDVDLHRCNDEPPCPVEG